MLVIARNKRKERELSTIKTKFLTLLRLGSRRRFILPNGAPKVKRINTIDAIDICSNKQLMKKHFTRAKIKTAPWFMLSYKDKTNNKIKKMFEKYGKIIAKHKNSSHGTGIFILETMNDYLNFKRNHDIESYIFEKYYNYSREYRIHVYKDKCFHAVRKLLKQQENKNKGKHLENCVFINEQNPKFNTPETWDTIKAECIKALKACKLDLGCLDVLVNKKGDFLILEVNSNPGLGEKGLQIYKEFLQKELK